MHKSHVPRPFHPSSKRTLQTSICDLQPKLSNLFKFIFWPHFIIFFPAKFDIVIKLFERMAMILSRRGNSLLIVEAVSLFNNANSSLVAPIRSEAALLRYMPAFMSLVATCATCSTFQFRLLSPFRRVHRCLPLTAEFPYLRSSITLVEAPLMDKWKMYDSELTMVSPASIKRLLEILSRPANFYF